MRITSRRWLARACIAVFAAVLITGSVLSALHAMSGLGEGVLFSVAAVVLVVAALAVARGTGRRS